MTTNVFMPVITQLTPSLNEALTVLVAIAALIVVLIVSSSQVKTILRFLQGPDPRAGWSSQKRAAYDRYKKAADYRDEFRRIHKREKKWKF